MMFHITEVDFLLVMLLSYLPQGDSDRALEAKRSRAPEVREPVAKRGSSGTPLQLGTNSIILKLKPGAGIWEYHVSFDPQLDKKVISISPVFSSGHVKISSYYGYVSTVFR